jgi:hypothetical protein
MIDRHYGHLARDGREHAVALLDAFATETAAWTPVDAATGTANRLRERTHEVSGSPTFGAVDVSWTSPLRNVA